MYALADKGQRVRCPHPYEYSTVEKVTPVWMVTRQEPQGM
jgi:hypothetical protein